MRQTIVRFHSTAVQEPPTPCCRDCGHALDVISQPSWDNKRHITLWTCFDDPTCLLNGVTLSPDQYNRLNDAQWEEYRVVNRKRQAVR